MKKPQQFFHWLKEELIRVIPAVIYFAIAFNLIYFTVGLSMEPGTKRYLSPLLVTIGAIIVGKILLILGTLPFINLSPRAPLAWQITWKFLICSVFIFFFTLLDFLMKLMDHWHSFNLAILHLDRDLLSPLFWATEAWLFITFFIYVVFSEFANRLGKDQIMRMLFKKN